MIKEYIQYLRNNPKHYWFKTKLYGWGWTPATWQGWSVLAVYTLLLIACAICIPEHIILSIAVATILLLAICYMTGEKPRWRWGVEK